MNTPTFGLPMRVPAVPPTKREPWISSILRVVLVVMAGLVMGGASWTPQSNPGLLEQVGSWPGYGRGPAADVSIAGNLAYVAIDEGGLLILDIGDPANPRRVGEYRAAGRTLQVQVVGSRAYLGTSVHRGGGCAAENWRGHLLILDITQPTGPVLLGELVTASRIQSLHVEGNLAWVGNHGGSGHEFSLSIADVSDPAHPALLRVDPRIRADTLVQVGSRLYTAGDWSGVKILDIRQPDSPEVLGTSDDERLVNAIAMQAVGNHLYLAVRRSDPDLTPGGLLICELGEAATPRVIGALNLTGVPTGIRVTGSYACVTLGAEGVVWIDVSIPEEPVILGTYDTPGFAMRVVISGNLAFVADHFGGVQVLDFADLRHLVRIGSFDTGLTSRHLRLSGNRAYLLSSDTTSANGPIPAAHSRVEILDLTQPTRPTLLGFFDSPRLIHALDVVGDLAYLPWQYDTNLGLAIVDVRDPTRPTELSEVRVSTTQVLTTTAVTVRGGQAYFTTGDGNLRVLDVGDPTHVVTLDVTNQSGTIGPVAIQGDYVYGNAICSLEVWNAAQPGNLVRIASFDLGECGFGQSGVVIANDIGFLRMGTRGFSLVDIRHPDQPVLIGAYDTRGEVHDLAVHGPYAYVAEGWAGLEIFDLSLPERPLPIARLPARGQARGVRLSADYVYLAEGGAGLSILGFSSEPLTVLEHPAGVSVAQGDSATLTVRAAGRGSLSYQWYRGETGDLSHPIEGANSATFTTPALTEPTPYWVRVRSGAALHDGPAAQVNLVPAVAIERLSLWPELRRGPATDVQMADDLALVTVGSAGLRMFSVADPNAPRVVGNYDTQGAYAAGLAVSGHRAFVACGEVHVVDFSDPTRPVNIGRLLATNRVGRVAVVGSLLYALGDQLRILDISDSTQPRLLGSLAIGGMALAVSEGFAYVGSGRYDYEAQFHRGALTVIDVTDPTQPRATGVYETHGFIAGISVQGNHVYLVKQQSQGSPGGPWIPGALQVLNVSNRAQPVLLGESANQRGEPKSVCVSGRYAYAAIGGFGVQVFDVTNPAVPRSLNVPTGSPNALAVVASRGRIVVAAGDAGLQVIDVSNPALPWLLGEAATGGSTEDVAVLGTRAYVASGLGGLNILDVRDPARPVLLGTHPSRPQRVAAGSQLVCVSEGSLQILDADDPVQVRSVATIATEGQVEIAWADGYAYLAGKNVTPIDARKPAGPEVGEPVRVSSDWYAKRMALAPPYALLALNWDGIQVLDLTAPDRPRWAGAYYAEAPVMDVALQNGLACVILESDGETGLPELETLDIRDVRHPTRIGGISLSSSFSINRVAFMGNYACVTGDGLQVIDLGNPKQPVRVGQHSSGIPTYGLQVVGDLAYVAAGDYGLAIYRITPQLRLNPPVRNGDSLHLSWLGAPGVRLQTTPTLLPPDWQDVPGSDGASRAQRPATNRGAFYRLVMH